MPFGLLSESCDPTRIVVGAIVIIADAEDPVFARVHAITPHGTARRWRTSSCSPVTLSTTPTPCAAAPALGLTEAPGSP